MASDTATSIDVPAVQNLWDVLLSPSADREIKSLRWKAFRKGFNLLEIQAQLSNLGYLTAGQSSPGGLCWTIAQQLESADRKSMKLQLAARDGLACESVVLFPRPARATACLSTQIGCAVGCVFCATGRMGLRRNLTTAEIIEQLCYARQLALISGRHLRNVVFMGMGEPLHNFDALLETLEWIVADDGFGISPRHVTVSTIGVPGKMLALAKQFPLVRLALSLHSPSSMLRQNLIPRANVDPMVLRETIVELNRLSPTHPVWLEYVLLKQTNDSHEDAEALIEFCRGLKVEINLIPYNPIDLPSSLTGGEPNAGFTRSATSFDDQERFIRRLREAKIFTTLRKSLGQSISAACGQLAANPPP